MFKNKLLLLVLLVSAVLRIWNLGGNPPHLTPDEASLGYNAYSILKTGRDEYGELMPFVFKSFGDYKPGLYIYTAVPFVGLFGLTEFSVRLPSAIAGIIAVWLVYKIVEYLFPDKKRLPLLSAFILSISPWHIHFSRGSWEVNLALTLTLAGIYLFFKSFTKQKFLLPSALLFGLTLIAYQGAKLSTGIVLVILLALHWKKLIKFKSSTLAKSVTVGLIISLPILLSLFQGKAGRLNVFSVFSYPRPTEYLEAFLDESGTEIGSSKYYLFYSETLNFTRGILGRWFNHFSGDFLFFEGDWQNPRHTAPNHGVLLLGDLILLIVGAGYFLKEKVNKNKSFVWLWMLLAPLPAVLSRDQVHAVRSYNLVIPLTIILAFGANSAINFLNKNTDLFKKSLRIILGTVYLAGFLYFLDAYFVHLPKHDSNLWEYGYKQVVETVKPIQNDYQKIKVRQSFAQPYIYFLFYGGEENSKGYDPATYQQQAKLVESEYKGDVGYIEKLDNIEFAPIDWSVNRGETGTLFVADPVRIPPQDSSDENLFKLIKDIKYLNGRDTAFRIIEVK